MITMVWPVGVIDSGGFKGGDSIAELRAHTEETVVRRAADRLGEGHSQSRLALPPAVMDSPVHLVVNQRAWITTTRSHGHLWRGGPGEAAAHRQGAGVLMLHPVPD